MSNLFQVRAVKAYSLDVDQGKPPEDATIFGLSQSAVGGWAFGP